MHPSLQARIRIVQSPANRWVKALRAAVRTPPSLAQTHLPSAPSAEPPPTDRPLIALEGPHLLAEALRSGLAPSAIFLRQGSESAALDALAQAAAASQARCHPEEQRDEAPAFAPASPQSPATRNGHHEERRDEGLAFRLAYKPRTRRNSGNPKTTTALIPLGTELLSLPPALFTSLTDTESPQPLAALLAAPRPAVLDGRGALVLVLASIQDPGNLGTLVRSAEAFGATAALLLAGTATPWSAKALRASAGSSLRLPLLPARDAAAAAALLQAAGIRSYAAVPSGGEPPSHLPLTAPAALWIGNEGAGLSPSELAACAQTITLPMPGETESLNAAVAGSLLLYEAARQRTAR